MKPSILSTLAVRVAVVYAIISLLYIMFSDSLLGVVLDNYPSTLINIQIVKGSVFVLLTALLLYLVLQRELNQRHRTEMQYKNLFHANPNPMLVYDEQLNILEVNEAAVLLYGYSAEQFRQMTLAAIRPTDERDRMHEVIPHFSADLSIYHTKHLKADASLLEIEVTSHRVDWNGKPARVVLMRDMTHQRQAEAAQRQLQQEKDKRELVSRFTSMVVHEFRTPLTVIQTSAGMLKTYAQIAPEKRATLYGRIENSVKRLAEMSEQMLLINRLESGRVSFQPQLVDLEGLVGELMQVYEQADQSRIDFAYTGSHEIMVDRDFVQHILNNLISNALKYTPDNTPILVRINVAPEQIVIKVQDEGIGIPAEELPKVFEPFARAKNAKHIPGTGLGLAIVKTYVEQAGGTIQCASQPEQGTTFTVYLPRLSSSSNSDKSPATSNPA